MLKKLYWIILVILVLAGVALVLYYGTKPRPVPKIKLSNFEEPGVLSRSLLLRLNLEIKNSPVLVIGADPKEEVHFLVWQKFFEANQEAGSKYDSLVVDKDLGHADKFPGALALDTLEEIETVIAGVQGAIERNERVAILVPTVYSSQLVHANFVQRLKERLGQEVTSISLSGFPRTREGEKTMPIACVVEGVDDVGTGGLGCMIVQMSRNQYRNKKVESGKWVGLAEQVGLRDYLVLLTIEP